MQLSHVQCMIISTFLLHVLCSLSLCMCPLKCYYLKFFCNLACTPFIEFQKFTRAVGTNLQCVFISFIHIVACALFFSRLLLLVLTVFLFSILICFSFVVILPFNTSDNFIYVQEENAHFCSTTTIVLPFATCYLINHVQSRKKCAQQVQCACFVSWVSILFHYNCCVQNNIKIVYAG